MANRCPGTSLAVSRHKMLSLGMCKMSRAGAACAVTLFTTLSCQQRLSNTGGAGGSNAFDPTSPDGAELTPDNPADTESDPPIAEQPALPIRVNDLQCAPGAVDPAWPRRILRLQPSEILASLQALAPLDSGSVPIGFDSGGLGQTPDPRLSVSKSWHDNLDRIAQGLASAIIADASEHLDCDLSQFGIDSECTTAFLRGATQRLFRGVVQQLDLDRLSALAEEVAARSGGETAMRYAVRAMALSPRSIYLTEGIERSRAVTEPTLLSPAELASFLSFRITGGPPSAALLDALDAEHPADAGRLRDVIEQHFTAEQLVVGATQFIASWIRVQHITTPKDQEKHPMFDDGLLESLQQETYDTLLSQFVAAEDGTLRSLLTQEVRSQLLDDANNPLVQQYGRPGVLALPGFIAAMSAPEHTNIPKRGRVLADTLFCEGAVPPPPNIEVPELDPELTQRERFEAIEQLAGCGPCHSRVNPLAYAFERYDEIGNPRTTDEQMNPIDTSGEWSTRPGDTSDFNYTDLNDFAEKAAANPLVHTCVSMQAFQYVARRVALRELDDCTVQGILDDASANSFNLTELFTTTLLRTALAPRADR